MEPPSLGQQESLQKAKEELQKGLMLLAACQKRIRIANHLEFGWETVDEYEDDELALDEDDAKQLEKAAAKTSKKRKIVPQWSFGNKSQQQKTQQQALLPMKSEMITGSGEITPPGRSPKIPGPWFNCLEIQHLRASCPKDSWQYSLSYIVGVNKGMGLEDNIEMHCGIDTYSDGYPNEM